LHTGAGVNSVDARKPVIVERDGVRFGFLQRTSVYWSHGHEATATYPGVATIKAHTAYRPQIEQLRTLTRPGMPPEVVTWADPAALAQFREDIAAIRAQADVVIASHHWGLDHEVLAYQVEIAHTAIDAGADLVMGHGPHLPLGIELYQDKPIFYGVGSFSFETGHRGRAHPDWIGLMLHVIVQDGALAHVAFAFVRHNAQNETVLRPMVAEQAELDHLRSLSKRFSTVLEVEGDEVVVWRKH
jgi:poly-gamma-glutamate capsule biosynthesis protein CapA/YwtB (metallophosphatase superfamily)